MNNIKDLLLLNFLNVTNRAIYCGEFDIPKICCTTTVYPDFLALDSERRLFNKTIQTGVCFFRYDKQFNGYNGLYNAIYYNKEKELLKFKQKYKGVVFVIEIDPSLCGDVPRIENLYRIFQRCVVSLWLTMVLGIIVIPLISYANEESFGDMLLGIDPNSTVVAFGIKGNMNNLEERELLRKAVKYVVDRLSLKAIVVYSVCGQDSEVYEVFSYAIEKGIELIIPQNTLREQNQKKWRNKNGEI
jgi:hypothetical protein